MTKVNDIVLRPRFKIDLEKNNEKALKLFDDAKISQSEFVVSRVDDHVFIKLPRDKQHFWSPQLHLEINEVNESTSTLHGLFGPNPSVWTMFMFFHFLVVVLFIGFGVWAYSNWSLDTGYAIQLFVTLLMIVLWIVLYFGGRIGKASGKDEMHLLNNFMRKTLNLKS
jgi:hypothetical protein